ncbi:MAG: S41 family peptidase [Phycisphaeraceae bacterium]|nr:S41 family peptidase [Phycisphaeraceae bacterium]
MTTTSGRHDDLSRSWRTIALALLLSILLAANAFPQTSDELPALANAGQFNRVLQILQSDPAAAGNERFSRLIENLQSHEALSAKLRQERQEAFDKSMTELADHLAQNRLDQALRTAVEANSLSTDPALMLTTPLVRDLVAKAEAQAQASAAEGDWLENLSIYRALYYLFDDHARFRAQMQSAERSVRLLRLYTPHRLKELYQRRAERLDKKDAEPPPIDEETWQQTLQDVQMSMLWTSLVHASHSHVNAKGYNPLLVGSIDALIALTQTKGLEDTFPVLAETEKVAKFQNDLSRLREKLDKAEKPLRLGEASATLDQIEQINRDSLRLPQQVLAYEMADGAMSTLDDFSAIIWPREMEQFSRATQGKFYGIGVQISKRDGRLVVITPVPNTPAQKAGIKAGDIIAQVDGKDTSTWSVDRAVREITGPKGTTVTLAIERMGVETPTPFSIVRDEIPIDSIIGWQRRPDKTWDYFIDTDYRIGYLRLTNFLPQTADDLDLAINQMQEEGDLNALIIDLRFNPGGLLSAAVEVANRFIPSGPIVSTVEGDGHVTQEYRARPDHSQPNMPVVLLINQGSASASEIVAGALQDYQRALLVGQRSFGKGSVQDLFKLNSGQAFLKLTTQYYRLPGGRIIHRQPLAQEWGVNPDLEVSMTDKQVADALDMRQEVDVIRDDDTPAQEGKEKPPVAQDLIRKGVDPQLETALLVLQTRLAAQQLSLAHAQANIQPAPAP